MGHRKAGFRSLYDWFKAAGCASRKTVLGPGGSPQEAGDKAIKPEPTKLEVGALKPKPPLRYNLYVRDALADTDGYIDAGQADPNYTSIFKEFQTYFNKMAEKRAMIAEEDKAVLEALKTLRQWLQTVN